MCHGVLFVIALCCQAAAACACAFCTTLLVARAPSFIIRSPRPRPVLARVSSAAADDGQYTDADTLSTKELAERLRLVRAGTRSEFENATSPEAIAAQLELCDQLHSTRFRNLALSRCESRPSDIHGNGLFATRHISADELITLYPGDALLAWGDEYGGRPGPVGCPLQAMYGPHVSEVEQASPEFFLLRPGARDFEVVCGRRRSIVGDPARSADPAYLGHLANDAACLRPGGDVAAYEKASDAGANAAHLSLEGCHFVTVATRPIDAGEEILVSYGEGFWLARVGDDHRPSSSSAPSASGETKGSTGSPKKKKKSKKPPSRGFGKR